MSGLSDHEREALQAIERELSARDERLAHRLARPGWFLRWRWGTNRQFLIALLILVGLGLILVIMLLTQ